MAYLLINIYLYVCQFIFILCVEGRIHFFLAYATSLFSELLKLLAMTLCLLLHDNLKPGVCYGTSQLFCCYFVSPMKQNGLKRPLVGVYTSQPLHSVISYHVSV